jgi:hypothetical protein
MVVFKNSLAYLWNILRGTYKKGGYHDCKILRKGIN